MKEGKLRIKIDSNNNQKVECHLSNSTVWMDRNELCELFGCYMKDIDRCIGGIVEKNILRVEDTCRYHLVAAGKRISYDITAVNLTVIITMAFRLDTSQAKTIRMWFLEQFTKTKGIDAIFPDIGERFRLN